MKFSFLPLARLLAGVGAIMAGVAQAQLANNLTIGQFTIANLTIDFISDL